MSDTHAQPTSTTREQLVHIARRGVAHYRAGTQDLLDATYEVPATNYYDPERWQREVDLIFKRLPLMLGFSSELRNPGDYRAMEVAGVPVLLNRAADGAIKAFVNMCSHRGAIVVEDGVGNARRFACPYHAWTYDNDGDLVGMRDPDDFGEIDRDCLSLTPLPVTERSGLIWVVLTPGANVDFDAFLCGYDTMLECLGFDQCHVAGRQSVEGPNWKLAYDGYLDYYHLPILHRETFGPDYSSQALYDAWGPHQRVTAPDRHFAELAALDDETAWPDELLNGGVWTIFPHISIAAFDAAGKVFMVSQLFPGATADESVTTQHFLHTGEPTAEVAQAVEERMAFLEHVVRDEDYYTGKRINKAVKTGAKSHFLFGRNEGGGQRFHRWVDAILDTDDAALPELFARGIDFP